MAVTLMIALNMNIRLHVDDMELTVQSFCKTTLYSPEWLITRDLGDQNVWKWLESRLYSPRGLKTTEEMQWPSAMTVHYDKKLAGDD